MAESFDAAGIKTIIELVSKLEQAREYKPGAEPEHIYFIPGHQTADGKPAKVEATPHPREHTVNDLPALITALSLQGEKSVIFYSRNAVVGVYDNDTRRDVVTLNVGLSPQVLELQNIAKGRAFKQPELVRWLKISMCGCLNACGNLLEMVRTVKFDSATVSEAAVLKSKASIGKQIRAELQNGDEFRDYYDLDVPMFANPQVQNRQTVRVAFDIDPQDEKFIITPIPLALDAAIADAELYLGKQVQLHCACDDDPSFAAKFTVVMGSL